jgi:exodeoxyribonuclease VIII
VIETPTTGLVRGLPTEQYHADPALSNTMLSAMNKSPAHCYALHRAPYRPQRVPTDAMLAGTLAHTAILEYNQLLQRYVAKPVGMNFATKEGKAWRDAQTLEIVSAHALDECQAQREAVHKVTALRNLLAKGDAENSLFWIDPATGTRCKARPDWTYWNGPRHATVLDIKTISELTDDSVRRAIATYGYHRQAAHYSNGMRAHGIEVEEFVFGFVSSSYPFIAAAYVLDDETMQQGRDEVAELVERYAECERTGVWPAFGDGYQLTGLPVWAKRSNEIEVSYAD